MRLLIPHLAWYPSPMRWGCSSRPKAAAKPEESYRVQSSKRRWQKAEVREKDKTVSNTKSENKKVRTVCAKNVYIQDPILTLTRQTPENVCTTICAIGNNTFKYIHMQNHNHHETKRKNKTGFQQRYRPGVGEPRFNILTLKAFWASSWGWVWWRGWVRAVRASFLLANHPRGWGHIPFSATARQSWPFDTQPQTPASDLTHPTPPVPNPVTPSPNTFSPTPKDSYTPSLTFSAPICQNHNLYTSPLITKQEKYHLKINLS